MLVAKKIGKLKWRSRKDLNTRITVHSGFGAVARGDGEGEITVYDFQHCVVNEGNNPKLYSKSVVVRILDLVFLKILPSRNHQIIFPFICKDITNYTFVTTPLPASER